MEQQEQNRRPNRRPAVENLGRVARPHVEGQPDKLLGSKVGVAAVRPESGRDEPPIQLSLVEGVGWGDFSRLLVLCLRGLIV